MLVMCFINLKYFGMRRLFLISLFIGIALSTVKAQDYNTAIGIRLGLSNGISAKHFISSENAIEGILNTRWGGFYVVGLYEWQKPINDVPRLYWYYGAGGHVGVWSSSASPWFNESGSYTVLGIDGILGLEYVFKEAPINISLDWKPGFNVLGNTGFWGDELALSGRFYF